MHELGMNATTLAKASGNSDANVSRFLRGLVDCNSAKLFAMFNALGIGLIVTDKIAEE